MGPSDRFGQCGARLRDPLPADLPGPLVESPIDVRSFDEDKLSCHEFIILLGCDKNSRGTSLQHRERPVHAQVVPRPRIPNHARHSGTGPRQRPEHQRRRRITP